MDRIMDVTLQRFADKRGGWRFRGTARNGEIVFQSEAYTTKEKCARTMKRLADAMFRVVLPAVLCVALAAGCWGGKKVPLPGPVPNLREAAEDASGVSERLKGGADAITGHTQAVRVVLRAAPAVGVQAEPSLSGIDREATAVAGEAIRLETLATELIAAHAALADREDALGAATKGRDGGKGRRRREGRHRAVGDMAVKRLGCRFDRRRYRRVLHSPREAICHGGVGRRGNLFGGAGVALPVRLGSLRCARLRRCRRGLCGLPGAACGQGQAVPDYRSGQCRDRQGHARQKR
jgi:hypothetical protein